VKCTIQPSFNILDPRFLVCFTLCTIRINGMLLLGVELQLFVFNERKEGTILENTMYIVFQINKI